MDSTREPSYLSRIVTRVDSEKRRIARARLLRREGRTYDEIRAVVGAVGDERLQSWLRGIPRPPATWRSHPKHELRRECRRLRMQGLTYDEIAAATGASAGSLSLWLRDLDGHPEVRSAARRHRVSGSHAGGMARSAAARARQQQRQEVAVASIGAVTERELLLVGAALYWAEGTKAKPWRPMDRQLVFINSDLGVLRVYLSWLDLLGVPRAARTYRLHIHETAEAAEHERWWAEALGVPQAAFLPPTVKRHSLATVRRNTGSDYHGCLTVRVRRSSALYDHIRGLWLSVADSADSRSLGSRSVPGGLKA